MKRAPRNSQPTQHWLVFLRNDGEVIAAMDFFTVPTLAFSMLYCSFVIDHDRRRILHFNFTRHPTRTWIVQQAAIHSIPFPHLDSEPLAERIAERWLGACRRECWTTSLP